jgi:Tol biopolymer transport system component
MFTKLFSAALLTLFIGRLLLSGNAVSSQQPTAIGVFEGSGEVGAVGKPGAARYDAAQQSYTITGGGENMWGAADGFHFVWKRLTGDLSIAADIKLLGEGGNAHRKAVLILRQSLDADSAYADAALHGDGLASLQYRETKGGPTREIQSNLKAPQRLQLEKQGDYVFMSVAPAGAALRSAGGSFRLRLTAPFYVGLGVCAHDNNALETAVFANVEIKTRPLPVLESTLETIAIASKDRKVVYTAQEHFEAPNWSRDGKYFLLNRGGRIIKLPVTASAGSAPETINTGFAVRCNNDHGISPDGTQLVISDQSQEQRRSLIYILPINGGTPRRVTQLAPSYWHGWSPDGKTLAYCAERNGNYDIYTIPVTGGEEKRLTAAEGLDDGPDYAHDGQYIYFNSVRTGLMQIWRMRPDGSEQTQVTKDDYNNWFAHPSPDGKWLVFLSYEKDVTGHPANKDVMLRLMPVGGGEIQVLAKLFGGQGTINVPSWSPDSGQLAFVSYRLVSPSTR